MSLQLLTKQINSIIAQDESMRSELEKLASSEVAIALSGLGIGFVIDIADGRVCLTMLQPDMAYEATIVASALDFMYMMRNKNKKNFVFPRQVKFMGDGEQAMRLLTFLGGLDIDWESYLASYIGDAPSHIATKVIQSGMSIFANFINNTKYNIADFITDEIAMVPTSSEVNEFCEEVTVVRDDVARLEARLNRLSNNDKENK
jgi:ubiquinone biosynthesis accessory factor UbiJ